MMKKILIAGIGVGVGIALCLVYLPHAFASERSYLSPSQSQETRYILPAFIIDMDKVGKPGEGENMEVKKDSRNPSKEAEDFAKLIKRLFSKTRPGEIILLKLEDGKLIILYLVRLGKIVDPQGKPLTEQKATEVFKDNPQLWQATLLKLYYEANKPALNSSFEKFVRTLLAEEKISPEVAFLAGLLGKGETRFMEKVFAQLPAEKRVEVVSTIRAQSQDRVEEAYKGIIESAGENILRKMVGANRYNFDQIFNPKGIFLRIGMEGGMKFLGLLVSLTGMALVSPQGVISSFRFSPGEEITLADFLKMVVKAISLSLPLVKVPAEDLPIRRGNIPYFQYAFIIWAFWFLKKRAERVDWDVVYEGATNPVRNIYLKSREKISQGVNPIRNIYFKSLDKISNGVKKVREGKETLRETLPKILIKVNPVRSPRRRRGIPTAVGITSNGVKPPRPVFRHQQRRISGYRKIRRPRESFLKNAPQMREVEERINNLYKTKYWVGYLLASVKERGRKR